MPPAAGTSAIEQVPTDPADRERVAGVESAPLGPAYTDAIAEAVRTGEPVEVAGVTTETTRAVALPSGKIEQTVHAWPVRTRKAGSWQEIDATLERGSDGLVRPWVAAADIVLSGGGDRAPLAVVGHEGKEVGLSWPGVLPEPVLVDDTATYPEVLSGVDLKITVDGFGFSQVLVVKTAQAAMNPALREIRFGNHTRGTQVTKTDVPGPGARSASPVPSRLSVVDADGQALFTGDASRMWDSSGEGPAADRLVEPDERDRAAVMGVRVTDTEVAITPDQAFLTDPATTYPVYIDPSYSCGCGRVSQVVLYKYGNSVGESAWNDTYLKTGYVYDSTQGVYITARSYITFDLGSVPRSAAIHWAKLYLTVNNSYSNCPGVTQVHVTGGVGEGTRFGSEPGLERHVGNVGAYTGCPGEGGWSTPGHDGNRGDALSNYVREIWAAGGRGSLTFGLFGDSESVQTHWRRFRTNPGLTVQYNTAPHRPSELGAFNGQAGLGCTNVAAATVVGRGDVTLRARLTDSDPGSWARGSFVVYRDGVRQGFLDTGGQPSGGMHQVTVPPEWMGGGGVISWRVQAWDGDGGDALSSPWTGPLGAPDDYCRFTRDTVSPDAPGVQSVNGVYPPYNSPDVPTGGVGVTGRFKFTPGAATGLGGTVDVVRYLWSVGVDDYRNSVAAKSDGTAEVSFTPLAQGDFPLYVKSVDRAGNQSSRLVPQPDQAQDYTKYLFRVPEGSAPVAHWTFENGGEDVSESGAHPLAFQGMVTTEGAQGHVGQGLQLGRSVQDVAVATGPVVDPTRSLSLSAWVWYDPSATGDNTAVPLAIDDTYASPLMLAHRKDDKPAAMWSLGVSCNPTTPPCLRVVWSDAPAQKGVWTHLALTVDDANDTACFYVNGVKQSSCLTGVVPPASADDILVGRGRWEAALRNPWYGRVDDVRVYNRLLVPSEVAALANVPVERARYALAEDAGVVADDSVGANDGTLYGGGVSWVPDGPGAVFDGRFTYAADQWAGSGTDLKARWALDNDMVDSSGANAAALRYWGSTGESPARFVPGRIGPGVALDGVAERIFTGGTRVDTTRSYSVAAWVRIDHTNQGAAVMAQDGTRVSGYSLTYSKADNRWVFTVPHGDQDNAAVARAVSSALPVVDRWTHLVGSYDAAAGKIRLFVNGTLESETSFTTPWSANGTFTVGRSLWNGAQGDFFPGVVDELRVYSRAVTAEDAHGMWNRGSDVNAPLAPEVGTDRSFSIAGWAKADAHDTAARSVFSLGGSVHMPLTVGYRPSNRRWEAMAASGLQHAPVIHRIYSNEEAVEGEWVHLAVTYDAGNGQLRLYVNGAPQTWMLNNENPGNLPYRSLPQSLSADTGRLLIGRGTWTGLNTDAWRGQIRDVRVFSGVLSPQAALAIANGSDGGGGEET
ncbi:LamG-like jellyroll fold domain-containing protein [Saccharothrix sp. NRRL B-16348]|uniref:LamG-like jellyroll fold domain-containing protein n=1 Tax=Saccharothrix sp. NRRL B-16348 TaxID=1415542 RepID=UPI000AB94225|nr:LamG-like jellyroll fold domain-containing protein [Saccharothrix sp. NRRL B-16348]